MKIAVGSVTGGIKSSSVGFPPPNGVRGRFPAWDGVHSGWDFVLGDIYQPGALVGKRVLSHKKMTQN